ncbi:unnamed protein product [Urochloa decumbens]|uniref:DUF1618 domain-containing protein n=1 Tax=Urochloa decumbens TaxID=240449 RepID=A0ABC9D3U2_9POAL
MAPPWVLLHRIVNFVDGRAAAAGGSSRELSPQEAMAAMKPYQVIAAPPEVTHLSMLLQTPADDLGRCALGGDISSTDKGIVVLYSGFYRPGNGGFSGDGCYMVYDAPNNALSAIPPLPDSPTMKGLGRTAVVMRHGSAVGDYSLAELVTTDAGFPEAKLCVWSPSSSVNRGSEWIQTPIRLPLPAHLTGPTCFFHIDMAFSFAGCFCWVDLFSGLLVCDPAAPQGPKLSFVPLPLGYCLEFPQNHRLRMEPETFRSMGCVCGAIKFVALVGYTMACPSNEVMLKSWTLSSDFKEWKEGSAICVGDLWDSESFNEMELPRLSPMCPVLSMNEDEVIYAILNDIEHVDDVDEFGDVVGVNLVPKAHYMIRLDILQNKVLSSTKSSTGNLELLTPTLLASDFSAYLKDPKDRQRAAEASKVAASVKRVKY